MRNTSPRAGDGFYRQSDEPLSVVPHLVFEPHVPVCPVTERFVAGATAATKSLPFTSVVRLTIARYHLHTAYCEGRILRHSDTRPLGVLDRLRRA